MLRINEVAERLGVSRRTAFRWRRYGCFPPAAKEGKPLLFREEDVDAWLADVDGESGLSNRELIRLDEREAAENEVEAHAEAYEGWGVVDPGAATVSTWVQEGLLVKIRELRDSPVRELAERLDALEAAVRAIGEAKVEAPKAPRSFVGLPPRPEPLPDPPPEAQAIFDLARAENRDMTPAELARFNALVAGQGDNY